MKDLQAYKKKISIVLIISFALHVVTLFIVMMMFHNIQLLDTEAERLNKQALEFNGRTNNLEGCFKNNDLSCPDDKYFNSKQF